MNLNRVFLIGNITKDIELKSTPSGNSVASFGLATNRTWKDKNGQKQEQATFHNIVAWGKTAEVIKQYCTKGSMIMIEGRIDNRTYDKKDGTKGYISEVIVENFQFGPKSGNAGSSDFKSNYSPKPNNKKEMEEEEDIPVIEDGEEIDIKDIPF
jgi:single-strand DNA-binding protein